jgi:hypothetical protein
VDYVGRPDRKERPGFFLRKFRIDPKHGIWLDFLGRETAEQVDCVFRHVLKATSLRLRVLGARVVYS